jgi:hypothetical protein
MCGLLVAIRPTRKAYHRGLCLVNCIARGYGWTFSCHHTYWKGLITVGYVSFTVLP